MSALDSARAMRRRLIMPNPQDVGPVAYGDLPMPDVPFGAPPPPPTPYGDLLAVLDALPVLLRETRRRHGHSQRAAAEAAGLSFSTVSRIEAGQNDPRLGNIRAIIRYIS